MRILLMLSTLIGVWNAASVVRAQAVQLPTFHYFSVQTTVSVPDRGGVVLGGVNRASSGSTSRGFGPLRNRATGSSIGASNVSVHATIIDHKELDRQVLAEAARRRGEYVTRNEIGERNPSPSRLADAVTAKADHLSRNVATQQDIAATPRNADDVVSLAEIRAQATARQQAKAEDAAARLAAGIAAEEAGKLASARGYYEAAIRYGDEQTRAEALERLSKIALPPPSRRSANK